MLLRARNKELNIWISILTVLKILSLMRPSRREWCCSGEVADVLT